DGRQPDFPCALPRDRARYVHRQRGRSRRGSDGDRRDLPGDDAAGEMRVALRERPRQVQADAGVQGRSLEGVILIGELSLWVALLMAAWSAPASFAGGTLSRVELVSSGIRGLYAPFVMVLLASIGLWPALLSRDFSLEYVASHISANMPNVYVFTAF